MADFLVGVALDEGIAGAQGGVDGEGSEGIRQRDMILGQPQHHGAEFILGDVRRLHGRAQVARPLKGEGRHIAQGVDHQAGGTLLQQVEGMGIAMDEAAFGAVKAHHGFPGPGNGFRQVGIAGIAGFADDPHGIVRHLGQYSLIARDMDFVLRRSDAPLGVQRRQGRLLAGRIRCFRRGYILEQHRAQLLVHRVQRAHLPVRQVLIAVHLALQAGGEPGNDLHRHLAVEVAVPVQDGAEAGVPLVPLHSYAPHLLYPVYLALEGFKPCRRVIRIALHEVLQRGIGYILVIRHACYSLFQGSSSL